MRLLVLNQFASTPKYSTGSGERFYYLAKEFQKKGIETTVIGAAYNHLFLKYPPSSHLFNKELVVGIVFFWVRLKKYSSKSSFGRTFAFFEFLIKLFFFPIKKIGKPDIVIVSSMSIFPVIYASYLKWRYKIPFILEIRDIWPLTPVELGGYSTSHPFIKLLDYVANLGYRKSNFIVSVLPSFDRFLKKNNHNYKKFMWIPNGISQSFESNLSDNNNKDKFIICYTGAIGTANALTYFVEGVKLLKDVPGFEVWIVGEGPLKRTLIDISKGLEYIRFFKKVPKEDVINILSQADCCYIGWNNRKLYEYGVSANKYNDYMLAKKPILSSSNMPDDPVIRANCGLQVEAANSKAIAIGIKKMINTSKRERESWGLNGWEYVKKYKTYDVLADKYASIFNQLMTK